MANEILIRKGDVGDSYEPSDSEDDYSAHEKKLLLKVRRGRQKNSEKEQELLAFNQNEDDVDNDEDGENCPFEGDSDLEDENEDDGIPDARAWGKKRSGFFSTDFVDKDYSSYNVHEEELAEQEESEARAIQQRLAKQLEESDFTLDIFSPKISRKEKKGKSNEIILKKDLSTLSERQKEQLFKKESPEYEGLVDDFKKRMIEKIEIIDPALHYFIDKSIEHPIYLFIKNLNQLILSYCTNVSFYLVLKSKRIEVKNHPIVQRLVKIRQLLNQLDDKYSTIIKPQIIELLQSVNEGVEFTIDQAVVFDNLGDKKLRFLQQMEKVLDDGEESEGSEGEIDQNEIEFQRKLEIAAASESNDDEEEKQDDDETIEGDERRQITYQIAKNKGLTPYRKKELRNPRVKHRNKFRKALIRRKGAVRTVRKEIKRYDGEKFGIKASVKKGIKIK